MRRALGACVLAAQTACLTIASTVGTPSALERQLLGVYDELDRDLVLASSVRAANAAPPGSFEALKSAALDARGLQRFNEDDLRELKSQGCIAEAQDATVVPRPCPLTAADAARARTEKRVVSEENKSRAVILEWATHAYAREAGRPEPSAAERGEIRDAYHRLLREAARKGELFEVEKGVFREVAR